MGGNFDPGYTQPERAASQREMDMLRSRVDQMDTMGTRGIGAIAAQVAELSRDVSDLKADTGKWQVGHERLHEQDQAARVTFRRWAIGIGVAGLASMATVITMLVDLTQHLHG